MKKRREERDRSNSSAVTGFVLGLVSIPCAFMMPFAASPPLGILISCLGLVSSFVGMIKAYRGANGMSFAAVGFLLSLLVAVPLIAFMIYTRTSR